MRCPICNFRSTRVVDSRLSSDGMSVRRRRECERDRCGYRFSTAEEMEVLDVSVIKRDGSRQAYLREKVTSGLKKALEKRPYTDGQFHGLTQKIERDIQKRRTGEIMSEDIGEIIMRHLKRFDKIAYIRFASVYHSFEDLATFEQELEKLTTRKAKRARGG